MDDHARKSRAAALSVASNTVLVAFKLAVGLAIGSVSVMSEAIHSGVDLLAAGIAWFSVRRSGVPADDDHPFGHGKLENVSGTVEAILILVAAIWIIVEAIAKLLHPTPVVHASWGVAVMAVSAITNFFVARHLMRVGKETDSVALTADGWHLRTDVFTSVGVTVALAIIGVGGRFWPGTRLDWVDPVAAIVVALLILHAAWELTVQAARDLFDTGLPETEVALLRQAAEKADPAITAVTALRTRKAGPYRFAEVTVTVAAGMHVGEAHRVTEAVEHALQQCFRGTQAIVHVEPCAKCQGGGCQAGTLSDDPTCRDTGTG